MASANTKFYKSDTMYRVHTQEVENMGTDIRAFIEYKSKIDNSWLCLGEFFIPRNYQMFSKMAGVRAENYDKLFSQRGLPEALSMFVDGIYESDKLYPDCCHSHSWLSADDLRVCINDYNSCSERDDIDDIVEYKAILASMNTFLENRYDVRIVFWFSL